MSVAPSVLQAQIAPGRGPGQKLENKESSGFYNPHNLKQRILKQQAVVREMRRRDLRQDRQKLKNLRDVFQNIQAVIKATFQNKEEFEAEVERRKKASAAIFGEGGLFSYVKYPDGKKVWFKGGQVAKVENEQVKDAHGNVSIRNMYDMEYNSKGLLVSYRSDVTDSFGHKESIYWHGATYSDDSVAYGGEGTDYKKLLTSYIEERTEDQGNKTITEWGGATYNENDQLSSYKQVTTDANGNKSTKTWENGQYDEFGRLTGYTEQNTDALGNTTTKTWSGGTYEKNHSYISPEETPWAQPNLLTGFEEEIIDSQGNKTKRTWSNGTYNEFGELVSYEETTTKFVNGEEFTETLSWLSGTYDNHGRLVSYMQTKTDARGNETDTIWEGGTYDTRGRLTHYKETQIDHNENQTVKTWDSGANGYDEKNRLVSYTEFTVDARGNGSERNWQALAFDQYNRVLKTKEIFTDPNQITKTKIWETSPESFNQYGQLSGYHETWTDSYGYVTEIDWQNAEYDQWGNLVSYFETTTDINGNISTREWTGATYDVYAQVLSYTEKRTDINGNMEETVWSGATYGSQGQLLSYTEQLTNWFGETQIKVWQTTEDNYNNFGDLLGFTETITGHDGSVLQRNRSGSQYNHLGQLIHYEEHTNYSPSLESLDPALVEEFLLEESDVSLLVQSQSIETFKTWTAAEYDEHSRLTHYLETERDTNGNEQSKEWTGEYNKQGYLDLYSEIFKTIQGTTITTEWEAFAFDNQGRATSSRQYQTISKEPYISVRTDVEGRTYDAHGQVAGGLEVILTSGSSIDGHSIFIKEERSISGATFDSGILTGYVEDIIKTGTDFNLTWIETRQKRTLSKMSRNGYTETTVTFDPTNPSLTHTVEIHRSGIRRDMNGRIVSYTDEIFDETTGPIPTRVTRLLTQFSAFNQLNLFADVIVSPNGDRELKITTDIVQDDQGHMIQFNETSRKHKTGAQSLPDNWNLLSQQEQQEFLDQIREFLPEGATMTLRPNKGVVEITLFVIATRNRVSSTYDALGRLIHSIDHQTSTEQDGVNVIEWTAHRFNQANQVASDTTTTNNFDEGSVSSNPNWTTQSIRTSMTYNHLGQISRYREKVTDSRKPDEKIFREVSGITYDSFGQIATSVDRTLTEQYEDETHTTITQSRTTEITRTDALFDVEGRLIGFREVTRNFGTSENGDRLNHTTVRVRSGVQYHPDHRDRVLGYTDHVTDSASPGVLTIIVRENQTFGLNDEVTEYTETITREGETVERLPDNTLIRTPYSVTETVHRTGIVMDDQGLLLSYFEERTSSASPAETQRIQYTATYDEQDRLASSTEVIQIVVDGQIVEVRTTNRSQLIYNDLNLMTSYLDEIQSQVRLDDGRMSEILLQTIHRTGMEYNSLQQLTFYQETSTRSDSNIIEEKSFERGRYDYAGRLESFRETTRRHGIDADGNSFDVTTEVLRIETSYNGLGLPSGYRQTRSSSDSPNLIITETMENMLYDEQGRELSFIRHEHHRNAPGSDDRINLIITTTRTNVGYDDRGRLRTYDDEVRRHNAILDVTENIRVENQTYNAWGQISSYEKWETSSSFPDKNIYTQYQVTEVDSFGRPTSYIEFVRTGDFVQENRRTNIQYDLFGQVLSYDESQIDQSTSEETILHWEGSYNEVGQLISFLETRQEDQLDTNTRREDITYNSLGQMMTYGETVYSSATPDLTTSISWVASGYNSAGLISSFSQATITSGPGLNTTERVTRDNITYLRNGLINGYLETRWSSASPDLTITIERRRTSYDGWGRENTFFEVEAHASADGSLNLSIDRERTDTRYNDRGQIIFRAEKERSSAAPLVTDHITWSATYDENNRIYSYIETRRQLGRDQYGRFLDRTSTRTVETRLYDEQGRLIYEESSYAQQGQTTQFRTWEALEINGLGQVTSERETVRQIGDVLNTESRTLRTNIVFDIFGRQIGFNEHLWSSTEPDFQTERQVYGRTYNTLGQLISEITDTYQYDLATNGLLFTNNETVIQTGFEYDIHGRLVASTTIHTDHDEGIVTTEILSGVEFNSFGIQVRSRKEIQRNSVIDGLVESYSTIETETMNFNQLGQPTRTHETSWNSGSPDLITTVLTSFMTYNSDGQLNSFTRRSVSEHMTDPSIYRVVNDQIRVSTQYNSLGQVIRTEDSFVSNEAPLIRNNVIETREYNRFGQVTESQRETNTVSADDHININQSQTITSSYNSIGQLEEQIVIGQSSQYPGLTMTETNRFVYDEAGLVIDQLTTTNRQGQGPPLTQEEIDAMLQSPEFQELEQAQRDILAQALLSGQEIDITETRHQSDIEHDEEGRITSYVETISSFDRPDIQTTITRENTTYNSLGQLFSFDEIVREQSLSQDDSYDVTTTRTRHETNYDARGRIYSYREESQRGDEPPKYITRHETNYNNYGYVLSQRDSTETRILGEVVTYDSVSQRNNRYDSQGRLISFQENSYSLLNGESTRIWQALAFGINGEPTRTRESGHSDQQGAWERSTENFGLDSYGRPILVHSQGTSSTQGFHDTWTTQVDTNGTVGINALGQSTYLLEFGSRFGLDSFVRILETGFEDSYDESGRAQHSVETLIQDGVVSITEILSQDYNDRGQVIGKSYSTTKIFENGETEITSTEWSGEYDYQGQLVSFTDNGVRQIFDADGVLSAVETNTRSQNNIRYNDKGQVISYDEAGHTILIAADGTIIKENSYELDRDNQQYNEDGQLIYYEEEGNRDGSNYTEVYQAFGFDENGQAIDFTKTGTSDSSGPYVINQENTEYNDFGQLISYTQFGVQSGQSFSKTVSNNRYNARGQLISTDERGETDAGLYSFSAELSYNLYGRVNQRIENGTGPEGNYSLVTDQFEYDVQGHVLSRRTVKTDSHGDVHHITWTADQGYDEMGRLISHIQTNRVVDAEGNIVSETVSNWTALSYFNNNLIESHRTISTKTNADGSVEVIEQTHTNLSIHEAGWFDGTRNETNKAVTSADGTIVETTNIVQRENISRYTEQDAALNPEHRVGRISGYLETVVSNNESPVYSQVGNITYDSFGNEQDSDRVSITRNALLETWDAVVALGQQVFAALAELFSSLVDLLLAPGASLDSLIPDQKLTPIEGEIKTIVPKAVNILNPNDFTIDIVHRTNGQKDEHGRVVSWTEITQSSKAPAKKTTSEIQVSYSGSSNELSTYDATVKTIIDGYTHTSIIHQEGYEYEAGRVVSVQGTVHESWQNNRTFEIEIERSYDYQDNNLEFDEQGRVTLSERITTNDSTAPDLVRQDQTATTYDEFGRVATRNVNSEEYANPELTNVPYYKTSTSSDEYVYDEAGRVIQTIRTSTDLSSPGQTINQTIKYSDFDEYGRATHLEINKTTDNGETVTNDVIVEDIRAFSAHGQATDVLRTTTHTNGDLTTETSSAVTNIFDSMGRLRKSISRNSQTGTTTIEGNIETHNRQWDEIIENKAYDRFGRVSQMVRTTKNDTDKPSVDLVKEFTIMEYDAQGRVTNRDVLIQENLVTGRQRRYQQTTSIEEFDDQGRPLRYTKTTFNDNLSPDKVIIENVLSAQYDVRGNMIQSHSRSVERGVNDDGIVYETEPQEVTRDMTYDNFGRVVAQSELNHTLLENLSNQIPQTAAEILVLEQELANLTGDELEAKTAMLEILKADLEHLQNQLSTYTREGMTSQTRNMVYNDKNQLIGATVNDIETGEETLQTNFTYDDFGMRQSYSETDSQTGNTREINLSYDAYFRVIETRTDHSEYALGDASQGGTPHTYTTIDQTVRFDSNGRAVLTSSTRLNDSAELDKVSVTETRLRYDEKGRVVIRETRNRTTGTVAKTSAEDPDNPIDSESSTATSAAGTYETNSTTNLTVKEFDLLGRTKTFIQSSRSSSAPAKEIITEGRYLYGENGEMAGTDAIVTEKGVGLNTSRHEINLTTKFSESGLALRTLRFVDGDASAPDKTTLTKDMVDIEYNRLGQVVRRSNTTHEFGPGLDKTSTLVEIYAYNQYGHVTTINRETTSNEKPDQTVVTLIENRAWDDQGRVTQSRITNTTTTLAEGDPEDIGDDIFDVVQDFLWQTIHSFDSNGQPRTLTSWTLQTEGEMNYWVKKDVTQHYDTHGRLYRSVSSVQEHKKSKEQVLVPVYANGVDTGEKELKFLTEVRSYNETKVFLEYNRLGQSSKISTRTTNDTKTGLLSTTNLQTLEYDSLGRVIDNTNETTTINSQGYRRSYTTRTQTSKFDEWGNPVDFITTTSGDSEAPDKVTIETTTGAKYENGRIVDANVTVTETGRRAEDGSIYSETNEFTRAWSYNAIGQMDGFWELNETQLENLRTDLETVGEEISTLSQTVADLKKRRDEIPGEITNFVDNMNQLEQEAMAPVLAELDQLRLEEAQWSEIDRMVDILRGQIPATEQERATMERALKEYLIEIGELADLGQSDNNQTSGLSPPYNQTFTIDQNQVNHFKNLLRIAVSSLNQFDFNVNFGGTPRTMYLEILNRKYDGGGHYTNPGHWMHKQTKIFNFQERRDSIKLRLRNIKDDFAKRRADGTVAMQKEADDINLEITTLDEVIKAKKDFQTDLSIQIQTIEEKGWTSTQTGIIYNENGQVVGQVLWNSEANKNTIQTGHQYDDNGNLLTYTQNHPDSELDQVDTVTMTYDSLGRLDTTMTETTKNVDGEIYKETSGQKVLVRDSSGRVTQLEITSSNSSEERPHVNVVSMTYDANNQVKSRSTTRYRKQDDGSRLYLGQNVTTAKSFYASGHIKEYSSVDRSATSPDLITTEDGTYIYGKNGKLVGAIKTVTEKGGVLNKSRKVFEVATGHDKLGRVTNQVRLTTDDTSKPGSSVFDDITIRYNKGINKDNTTWINRKETAENRKFHTISIQTDTEFDEKGRPKSVRTQTDLDSFAPAKVLVTEKTDIKYNELDQEISYHEKTTDSSAPAAPTEVDRFNLKYNGDGLLLGFVETNKDVRRDVTSITYNSQGWMVRQEENRSWGVEPYSVEYYEVEIGHGIYKHKRKFSRPKLTDWGTEGGNILGLGPEWTHGNVRMVQTYSYDSFGNITGHNIDVKGTGTNPAWLHIPLAGTGASRGLGVNGDLTFSSSRSNMKYDSKGRVVSYSQTILKYQVTTENYLSSSRRFGRGRKTKTRQVIGLVQTTTNEKNLDFNEFGQVTKSESTFYNTLGGHGWTKRDNIAYDDHGRMSFATTESYSVTPGQSDGKGFVAYVHSKKDQSFTYDDNGTVHTHDVGIHFHSQHIQQSGSGNFFTTDLGQLVKIAVAVAITALTSGMGSFLVAGAIAGMANVAFNAAIMYHMGAPPEEIWKASAVTFVASMVTAGGPPMGAADVGSVIAKRFILQKASQKIAERSGSTTAAFWTALASIVMSKGFGPQLEESYGIAMRGALMSSAYSALKRDIVRRHEGPNGQQSWALALLDGTGVLEKSIQGVSNGITNPSGEIAREQRSNQEKALENKNSTGGEIVSNVKYRTPLQRFGGKVGFYVAVAARSFLNIFSKNQKGDIENSTETLEEKGNLTPSNFDQENFNTETESKLINEENIKNNGLENESLSHQNDQKLSSDKTTHFKETEKIQENQQTSEPSNISKQSASQRISDLMTMNVSEMTEDQITGLFNELGQEMEITHENGQIKKVEFSGSAFGMKTTIHFDSMQTDADGNVILASGRIERETPLGTIETNWEFAAKGTAEFNQAVSSILNRGGEASDDIKASLTEATAVFTETSSEGEMRRVFLGENGLPTLSEHRNKNGDYSLYTYKKEESTGIVTGSIYTRSEKSNYELAGTFVQGGAENSLLLKVKESLTNLYVDPKNKTALKTALINVSRTHIEKDLNQNIQKEIGLTKDGQVAYVLDLKHSKLTVMAGNNPRQFYATQEGSQLFLVANKETVQQGDLQDIALSMPVTSENDVALTTNNLIETQSNVNKEMAQSSVQEAKEQAKAKTQGLADEIKKQTSKKISVKQILEKQLSGIVSMIATTFKNIIGIFTSLIAQISVIIESFNEVRKMEKTQQTVSAEFPGKILTTKGEVYTEAQLQQEEAALRSDLQTHFAEKQKVRSQTKDLNIQAVLEINRSRQASGEETIQYSRGDIDLLMKSDQIRSEVYESRLEKMAEYKKAGKLTAYFVLLKVTQADLATDKGTLDQLKADLTSAEKPLGKLQLSYSNLARISREAKKLGDKIPVDSLKLLRISNKEMVDARKDLKLNSAIGPSLKSILNTLGSESRDLISTKPAMEQLFEDGLRSNYIGNVILMIRMIEAEGTKVDATFLQKQLAAINITKFIDEGYEMILNSEGKKSDYALLWLGLTFGAVTEIFGSAANLAQRSVGQAAEDGAVAFLTKVGAKEETKQAWVGRIRKVAETTALASVVTKPTKLFQKQTWKDLGIAAGIIEGSQRVLGGASESLVSAFGGTDYHQKLMLNMVGTTAAGAGLKAKKSLKTANENLALQKKTLAKANEFIRTLNLEFSKISHNLKGTKNQLIFHKNNLTELKSAQSLKGAINERGSAIQRIERGLGRARETEVRTQSYRSKVQRTRSKIRDLTKREQRQYQRLQNLTETRARVGEISRKVHGNIIFQQRIIKKFEPIKQATSFITGEIKKSGYAIRRAVDEQKDFTWKDALRFSFPQAFPIMNPLFR